MAQSIVLTDDLDGKGGEVKTFLFSLDASGPLEIDLGKKNSKAFLSMIETYTAVARRAGSASAVPGRSASARPRRVRNGRSGEIRAWAKETGMEVNESGRIPDNIIKAYENRDNLPADVAGAKFQTEEKPVTV